MQPDDDPFAELVDSRSAGAADADPFAELLGGVPDSGGSCATAAATADADALPRMQQFDSFGPAAAAILATYRQMQVPGPGVAMTVTLPRSPPYTFLRPSRDEEAECMARLGLATAFRCLSVPNFVLCFACIVLERQVC